jgi:hypothetical protein
MKAVSVLISASMACSVAGCLGLTEPRDLARRKPFFDMVVSSPPDEVLRKCFSDWRTGPFRGGWSAWVQISMSEVHYLVDIMPASTGSHVVAYRAKYYENKSTDSSLLDLKAYRNATAEERIEIEQRLSAEHIYLDMGAITVNECLKELR